MEGKETENECEEPEFWEGIPEEILNDIQSVGQEEPLPEPRHKSSVTKKLTSLLQCFVLFMLLWQANCKLSNNGLEWLLRFLFQFLHLLGVTCNCEYLVEFCAMFPTSLYVLRKIVGLDRDDFVKYVVCPTCSSLHEPGNCTQRIGDRIVAKCCTNKAFKKGNRAKECGTKLAKRVVLSDGKECYYPFKVYCFNSVINQLEAMLKKPNKLMQLDSDDRQLLAETYQSMYPDKHILPDMVGEVCRKYSSVLLAGEKIGSRLECRSLRSARIMASWADQDGQVSSRTAFRPGIVLFFFANTIKFRGGSTRCTCLRV